MRIAEMNWMQVEDYLQLDNRCVLPLGSTEQHAYLSLATDAILAERVALDAAEPLGVPVFPAIPYGIAPYFSAFPGTITLSVQTYSALVAEVLDSLYRGGFRRILIVSGHGGNAPAGAVAQEWTAAHPDCRVRFHEWWRAPRTMALVREIDEVYGHASWMEAFPWTQLPGVAMPEHPHEPTDREAMGSMSPSEVRHYLGDGNYGGDYRKPDDVMEALWAVGVEETREALEGAWE
jgi:creatinine amidohydrolase